MPDPTTLKKPRSKTAVQTDGGWNVVVLNDPVNLMVYVVYVLCKVFGYDQPKATRMMLEVHHQGRSIVWNGERELAENYVHTLQQWQLTSILEKNAKA